MNTIIDKEEKKIEMHTALGIIEDEVARSKCLAFFYPDF